jgi:BMFP domain-containing protein YqiC
MMFNNTYFEDLSRRLSAIMPLAEEAREEIRTKIEQLLKKSFAGLDLLGREEFEAQRNALQRAELRIQQLEATLQDLDEKIIQLEAGSSHQ